MYHARFTDHSAQRLDQWTARKLTGSLKRQITNKLFEDLRIGLVPTAGGAVEVLISGFRVRAVPSARGGWDIVTILPLGPKGEQH